MAMIVVGSCDPLTEWHGRQPTIFRVTNNIRLLETAINGTPSPQQKQVWKLPYDRVAFYDLDVIVKPHNEVR